MKKLDEWHHKLSSDNPADTVTQKISSKALRESCWVKGPSLLKTTDWLFQPKKRVDLQIGLERPSCDIEFCLENLLRLLLSHEQFRSDALENTDPCDFHLVMQKSIQLSQCESFPSELKLFRQSNLKE